MAGGSFDLPGARVLAPAITVGGLHRGKELQSLAACRASAHFEGVRFVAGALATAAGFVSLVESSTVTANAVHFVIVHRLLIRLRIPLL